jgi:hypothetical protein
MTEQREKAPLTVYLLCTILLVQGVGAVGGGLWLLAAPSGRLMGLPLTLLEHTPFRDYTIPGLVVAFVLGVLPLSLIYPLLRRPGWSWANTLSVYRNRFWGWTYSLYVGIMLILWIDFQILWVGYVDILQSVFAFVGVLITIVILLPPVQRWYTRDSNGT